MALHATFFHTGFLLSLFFDPEDGEEGLEVSNSLTLQLF
jgi:hypothetical protein